jgi:HEAT repeat protein
MTNHLIDQLQQTIAAGNDEQTEQLVTRLTVAESASLLPLCTDADAEVRWWAARALAHCGDTTALPPLRALLTDAEPAIRAVAALALGQIGRRWPPASPDLLAGLAERLADRAGTVRQAAADALVLCGNEAVPTLAQVLQGDHAGARTRAAYALSKIATMPAAAVLYRCLNDPNYLVQSYAYETLEKMGLLENVLVTL